MPSHSWCDEGLFEQVMRHAGIGMALVTPEGQFLEVNAALCKMLGRSEATLKQLLLRDVTHSDDLERSLLLVEEITAGQRETFEIEKRYIHADGHQVWGQVSVSGLRQDDDWLFIVQILDITESRRQRQALADQERQYRLLAETAADVVCRLNLQGQMSWLSASVERSLGWRPDQLLGQSLEVITDPKDHALLRPLIGLPDHAAPVVLNLRLRGGDGGWHWMKLAATPITNDDGTAAGWITGWRDIQAEVEIRGQLDRALRTDPLTGLASRSAMLERISAALRRAHAHPVLLAVLSVGIDRLSQVNHALTHRAGDLLIATVASRLVEVLGDADALARGTGDTFIACLPSLSTPEQAGHIAERLRLASKGPICFEGHTMDPSVSIGVAIVRADAAPAPSADELLRDATLAMREAASQGRDRWTFVDPELATRAHEGFRLQEELRRELDGGELQAWFMPLVSLTTGTLCGYEALVRWLRPDGRLEMPDTFLPIARSCQLAEAIDLQILRQSIAALADLPPPLSVAANLSADTLTQTGLVEQVRCWLEAAAVAPERLHLEITETALVNLGPEVRATIQGLAELGVRWLVDDFGTGFSSISHLRDLPIHGLKLDRSFTEGLRNGDQKSVRLAQALAGLAEGLGLDTVAEGIETAEEVTSLRDLGWRCGQGWYFGKAAPLHHWQSSPSLAPVSLASGSIASQPPASRSSWALAVTDNVPVGLFALRLSPTGQPEFLFVSRRWLEMLQLEREQVMDDATPLLARVHPDDRAGLIQLWQQHEIRHEPLRWEGRLQIEAGPTNALSSWVLVEAAPLPQADGTRIWQGVMSDITDRKRQELHLRLILDEAPIAIAIQELGGENPRLTFVNQQFIRCFGYDLTTIPNLSDWAQLAYPDLQQRENVFQAWDASVARARRGDGLVEPLEAKVTTADGSVRDGLFSAVVLGEEMVISVLDITALRQAERELAAARASLADTALAITEAIPVGTYTMVQPPDGGIASFSFMSERFLQICGLVRDEAAADPFQAFACVHPDDYDAWVQLNAEAFTHKRPFYGECRVVADGQVRWISAESVPRELPDGSTVWEGVLTDITQQKEAMVQLEQDRALLHTVLSHIDAQVYMKDRQGRYLYANTNVEQLLLHGAENLVGYTDADLMPPEAARAIRELDEQVFREGGPLWREERLPLASGGERIFLSKKMLYRQPGQQDDCLIGFSTDITELRQATEQLAASEEHFRLLAENSSDVVFRVAPDGRIVWVSPSLTTALGWLAEDWIGQVGTQFLVHGGTAEHYRANLETLKMGGRSVIAREQIYAKDGSLHWAETHAGPYVNGKGVVDDIVASFRLIDANVEAEQQLRQSEQRHRLLADNIQDVVWTMDLQGHFTYISPSIKRLRGYSPEEVMAMPLELDFTPASCAIVQAGLAKAQEDVRAGRPIAFEAVLEQICKDGSTVWTDVKATGLYSEQGEVLEIVGVTRDVTVQRQLSEALRVSEERYRLIAENARDVIWTMEPDGRISYVSPSI